MKSGNFSFTLSECVVHNSHLGLMFKFFKEFLVFKEFWGFQESLGRLFIFQDALASLHLRWGLCVLGFAFWVRLHLGRKQAKQQAVQQHLGVSSQFVFGLEEKE